MGYSHDFQIDWQGSEYKTIIKIFEHLFLYRIKYDKPCVVLVSGDSGEGKSESMLFLLNELMKLKGLELLQFIEDIIIMTPKEYRTKLDAILHSKRLKKVHFLQLDDARMVIGSDTWQSFINTSISHVNALSRAIKPLAFFIITQSIKDIDHRTRRTITFELKCRRQRFDFVTLTPYRFWLDERDVENPRLRRRRVNGYVQEKGNWTRVYPDFKFKRFKHKAIIDKYKNVMLPAKNEFIDNAMNKLEIKIDKEMAVNDFERVNGMVSHFVKNPDSLKEFGEYRRKKWRLNASSLKNLGFNRLEKKEFEKQITEYVTGGNE